MLVVTKQTNYQEYLTERIEMNTIHTQTTSVNQTTRILVLAGLFLLFVNSANAQLVDGNLENLSIGTAPDDNMPAGAWHFPQNYIDNVPPNSEQENVTMFTIVETDSIGEGGDGNSLSLHSDVSTVVHLPNILEYEVTSDLIFRVETYIPTSGGNATFYVGGDHGEGGWSLETDRGPQVSCLADGTIIYASSAGEPIVVGQFEFDRWLQFELHISMDDNNYDLYYGPRGTSLNLLAADLEFRAPNPLSFVDRVTIAYFGIAPFIDGAHQYFDNFELFVLGDVNQDGSVNLLDVQPFVDVLTNGEYQIEADVNLDGNVDLLDVARFVELLSS